MSDEVPGLGYSIVHAPGQELHTLSAGDVGLPESSVALKSRFLKASDSRGLIADQEPLPAARPAGPVCCPWPPGGYSIITPDTVLL